MKLGRAGASDPAPVPRRTHRPRLHQPPSNSCCATQGLSEAGLDAGADTLDWHLQRHHQITLARATINRILVRAGQVSPDPVQATKGLHPLRGRAAHETWQSDFTHYRLTRPDGRPGADTEIITWLDDHSRYALHLSAHARVTTPIVLTTFTQAADLHGYPASTLTDNGMVYTVRLAGHGRQGGKNSFEAELSRRHIVQKNSGQTTPPPAARPSGSSRR